MVSQRDSISKQNKANSSWSDEELLVLINLWEEYIQDLRKPGRNGSFYRHIANRLQQKFMRPVAFTDEEVHAKLESLKRQYNYNKKKFGQTGSPSPWRFFKHIHRFYSTLPLNDTSLRSELCILKQPVTEYVNIEVCEEVVSEESNTREESDIKKICFRSESPQAMYPIASESNQKKNEMHNDSMMEKTTQILSKPDNEYDIFGAFVASEIRALSRDHLKKKLKRKIQKIILEVSEEDEISANTSTMYVPITIESRSSNKMM